MGRFRKFINERQMYVNVNKTKEQTSLGSFDSVRDKHIISQVKNVLTRSSIDAFVVELLTKKFYPTTGSIRSKINDLLVSYFSGDFPAFREEVLNNPYKVKLTDHQDSLISVANHYSKWLSAKFFEELTMFNPPIGGIGVGKGELILGLFTNLHNAIGAGDLALGNVAIEAKGVDARFAGQANKNNQRLSSVWHKDMNVYLQKLVKQGKIPQEADIASVHVSKSVTKTVLQNLFNVLTLGADKIYNNKNICTKLVELMHSYAKVKVDPGAVKLMQDTLKGGQSRFDDFLSLCGALCLWCYTNNEEFTILMMTDKKMKTFYVKKIGSSPKFSDLFKYISQRVKISYGWDITRAGYAFTFSG